MKLPENMNMKTMMKQAKNEKTNEQIQDDAGNEIVESSSGGGMVKVQAKAKGEILSIHEDEILNSGDKDDSRFNTGCY